MMSSLVGKPSPGPEQVVWRVEGLHRDAERPRDRLLEHDSRPVFSEARAHVLVEIREGEPFVERCGAIETVTRGE